MVKEEGESTMQRMLHLIWEDRIKERDKRRSGYTSTSGVLKDLHLAFITLANEEMSNVPPFLETESVKVIGVAMENDGTPLKPGIQFDERMKKSVGLKQDVGIKFVRGNPNLPLNFCVRAFLQKQTSPLSPPSATI